MSERAEYLAEVAARLWPAPAQVVSHPPNGHRVVSEFFVLPSIADARLVLPLRSRRAAATLALRYAEPRTFTRKARAYAMSLAVSSGAAQLLFRDRLRVEVPDDHPERGVDTIETLLADVLGTDVAVGLHVTRPRANRKPVLQAFAPDGTLLAVAKVATDDLTRELVAAEAHGLRHVGSEPRRTFSVPPILDHRGWHDVDVLTLGALPIHQQRAPVEEHRLAAVANEIAGTAPVVTTSIADSAYVQRLRARVADLRPDAADRLHGVLDGVVAEHGVLQVPFGAWHGDFTFTNLAMLRDDVLVWDWERYEAGVPVGYDLVHHHVQLHILAPGMDVGGFVRGLPRRTPAMLAVTGLSEAEAVAVTMLYLVEIATRYVHDRQDEVGMLQTVLPELLDALTDL